MQFIKVKQLNAVDTEMLNGINEFVNYAVTENRLEQGITFFNENNIKVDMKSTGRFLGWVINDILKEESDTIKNNNFDNKKIKSAISKKARTWFLNRM